MRNRKLVAVLVLAVLAVATAVVVMWPRKGPLGKRASAVETLCAACGHVEVRTLSCVPDTCSKCGEKQVYPAARCPKCGAANPLEIITRGQTRNPYITCRECGHKFLPGQATNSR